MPDVDSAKFRQLMGRFATGVVVITAVDPQGNPAGMTANSLASVSLKPPLLSVSVDHVADMHRTLGTVERFVINILAADQEELSRRFAAEPWNRFDGIGFQRTPAGLVILDGVLAHIECEKFAAHAAGDHTIYLGRVVGGASWDREPLLYYRGGYANLARA